MQNPGSARITEALFCYTHNMYQTEVLLIPGMPESYSDSVSEVDESRFPVIKSSRVISLLHDRKDIAFHYHESLVQMNGVTQHPCFFGRKILFK